MTDDRPAEHAEHFRGRTWPTCLYLCLLAAGVFAAWQIHLFWIAGGRSARTEVRPRLRLLPETEPAWPASPPGQLATQPWGATGLEALPGEPGGIDRPAGARRLRAFRRVLRYEVQEHAAYACEGELSAAADLYASRLRAAGFRLVGDRTEPSGRRLLVFHRDDAQAVVGLRPSPPEARMTEATLTVVREKD